MKKILFASSFLLAVLSACSDYNDQFSINADLSDVKSVTMTLAPADYSSIAQLAANQELALSKDPENKTYVKALDSVGVHKYFTEDASGEDYLPAYLNSKYPNADPASKFVVTYNMYQAPSAYLADFKNISIYNLTDKDYKTAWGENIDASYLSPSTLAKIPTLLKSNVSGAAAGDMKVVNYAYSDSEPSSGGGTAAVVYQLATDFDTDGNTYVIAGKGLDGMYYPFGKLGEGKTYGYMYPNTSLTVTADGIVSGDEGSGWTIKVDKSTNGYSLLNPDGKYLYMSGTYNSFNIADALPSTGGDWTFTKNDDGTFTINNVAKDKAVKLTLYNGSYSYGSYPASTYEAANYWNASLADNDGGFTIQNVAMEGVSYVWKYDTSYKYWRASAYLSSDKTNYPSDSWIVSPEIDLSTATSPQLTFDMAGKYWATDKTDNLKVFVSEDYTDDVSSATWTELSVPNWTDGSTWTFVNTGAMDLTNFKGKKIHIALRYISNSTNAATVEVKNFSVDEKSNYWNVYLFKEVPESEIQPSASPMNTLLAQATVTRAAASTPNASALYVYDGSAWSLYTTDEAKISVVGPDDYAALGSQVVADPEEVLPKYLNAKYMYAVAGDKVAVVYNKKADEPVVVEYTLGSVWSETTTSVPTTVTFTKDESGISAQTSTYLNETFLGDEGGFTIQDIALSGVTYVWTNTSSYGWKATAYASSTNNPAESWLVSPAINFKKAVAPMMTFEEAHRYLNGEAVADHFSVLISTDYSSDVTKATWTSLDVPNWSDGSSWDFVNIGEIDLSAYAGQTVYVAFKYVSNSSAAPTWEIKNLVIEEKKEEGTAE